MTTLEIFMNLAKEHTENWTKTYSDNPDHLIYTGVQFGIEQALEQLAQLPELAEDWAVKSIMDRISHSLPAFPVHSDRPMWWEDKESFKKLCAMSGA